MHSRLSTLGILALCLTVSAIVFPVLAADVAPRLDKFQGTWVLVSGERDGKKISDDYVNNSKMTCKGNQSELASSHQHSDTIFFEIVKLDPDKSPRRISLGPKKRPERRKDNNGDL
mgnify:CR=1 FL=1